MKLRKKQFKKYVKWLSMRIVKNNNFSIVSNSIIGDKMSRKKLKGVGQNVECKSDTVRKK